MHEYEYDMRYDYEFAMASKAEKQEYAIWGMQAAVDDLVNHFGIEEASTHILRYISRLKYQSAVAKLEQAIAEKEQANVRF